MKALLLICLITIIGCGSHKREIAAWQIAEHSATNKTELTQFLDHYKKLGDKDKYRAACFLVANMPNKYSVGTDGRELIYDIDIVKSDSLIQSLEYSFTLRDNSPFLKDYSFEQFCEYILPYRIANEPLEYYWKWDCVKKLNLPSISNLEGILKYATVINKKININTSRESWSEPLLGYTATIMGNNGKCEDRAILTTMAMRAYGIPAAVDFMPLWGDNNNGHSICSVILPNDSVALFQYSDNDAANDLMARKTPKVYRKMFSIQKDALEYKYHNKESIPSLYQNFNIKDVTTHHTIGQNDIELQLKTVDNSKLIYLSLFSCNGWQPVSVTKKSGNRVKFTNIGNGKDCVGNEATTGENIGDGILYLPCYHIDGNIVPAAAPIIVSNNGCKSINVLENETQTVVLHRKFPRIQRIINYANQMTGGIFEVANRVDFSDAKEVFRITRTPLSRLQRVGIADRHKYKYIRYRKPSGVFNLGELKVYDDKNNELRGIIISDKSINGIDDVRFIADNDPLTYFELPKGVDVWAGLMLKSPRTIGSLEFCPRTDDNDISPGDRYELFYWNNEWESAGVQTATEYTITFHNVPKGGLLWLRNLTHGKEERPFTYEDGKQVWW